MARPDAQSAGFALPCRFLGLTEIEGSDTLGKCAICGERLVYVCHMIDANGVEFDAGCDCAKTARLDEVGLRAMNRARREAAAARAAERREPGYKARVAAEAAARRVAYLEDVAARVAELEAKETQQAKKVAAFTRLLESGDDESREMAAEYLPVAQAKLAQTRTALETFRARLAERG